MNPFKKMVEINTRIAFLSAKNAQHSLGEIARLKEEKARIERILRSNPCLVVVS